MRDISRNVFFYLTFMARFFGAAPSNLLDDLLQAIGIAESSPKHIDVFTHTRARARYIHTFHLFLSLSSVSRCVGFRSTNFKLTGLFKEEEKAENYLDGSSRKGWVREGGRCVPGRQFCPGSFAKGLNR